ncbi:hypothetical protein BSZ19_15720 [Bradyrhizobium japonicum]|uniref:Uncharacterized protein n=1 Tax=Bradyrhizobium japonicum TaxID=375 RepID=A0A1Y2JT30_BRAJP|nr:hypothetical protein BSZ19_15720 [Bradyrhizobium japonicum]
MFSETLYTKHCKHALKSLGLGAPRDVRDFAFEHGCLDLIRKNREMAGSRDEYALSLWTAMPSGFVPA